MITLQTRFASSAAAVLLMPMAQTGSYAITMVEKSFTPCSAAMVWSENQLIRDALSRCSSVSPTHTMGLWVVSQRAQYLFVDRFIGFRKILAAFAMAEDHIFHFQLVEHQRLISPVKAPSSSPVHVLSAQVDVGAL